MIKLRDDGDRSSKTKTPKNERINFKPHQLAYKKMGNIKDGSLALKYQIKQSGLRLEAAKHGHSVETIAPSHRADFFLPRKKKYIKELPSGRTKKVNLNQTALETNQSYLEEVPNQDNEFFITENPEMETFDELSPYQVQTRPVTQSLMQRRQQVSSRNQGMRSTAELNNSEMILL